MFLSDMKQKEFCRAGFIKLPTILSARFIMSLEFCLSWIAANLKKRATRWHRSYTEREARSKGFGSNSINQDVLKDDDMMRLIQTISQIMPQPQRVIVPLYRTDGADGGLSAEGLLAEGAVLYLKASCALL